MAEKYYELRLRYNNRDFRNVEPFTRGLDFDKIGDTDTFLLWQLVAMMKRAGLDPRKEFSLCELEIYDKGTGNRDRVFAGSQHELTDDMLR
jgi:hypothetical protein